jgi:G3E family GTPase
MWLDKELESPLLLNSIICMIDSYNFFKNYEENEEILKKQLICSDKIVLNKLDLLKIQPNSEEIKQNINEIIKSTNPLSKVFE